MKTSIRRLLTGSLLAAAMLLSCLFAVPAQAAAQDLGETVTAATSTSAAGVKNHSKKGLQFGNANETLRGIDGYVTANIYNTENIYLHLNLANFIYECTKSDSDYLFTYNGKNYGMSSYALSNYNAANFKKNTACSTSAPS